MTAIKGEALFRGQRCQGKSYAFEYKREGGALLDHLSTMISTLLILCTTVLLGYSAPIELATDSTTPLPSTPAIQPRIVSVCLVNSTEQPLKVRCKLSMV